ncbi:MAG TPA: glycosyltransferase [Patescibacteria group bacterium]|nr:glycosyltransferase [Patescibacteria group bacterium]
MFSVFTDFLYRMIHKKCSGYIWDKYVHGRHEKNGRYRYRNSLRPVKNLRRRSLNGLWECTDGDPYFEINGEMPAGKTLLSWIGGTAGGEPFSVKLYADYGDGFQETDAILLPAVLTDNRERYSALVHFTTPVKALRLDPGEERRRLVFKDFCMYRMNSPESVPRPLSAVLQPQQYLRQLSPWQWERTDTDPYFELAGEMPGGYTLFVWSGGRAGDEVFKVKLYVDYGDGFTEEDTVMLARIAENPVCRYSAVVYFRREVHKLRVDPGEERGLFSLDDFHMYSISGQDALICAAGNYCQRSEAQEMVSLIKMWRSWKKDGISGVWSQLHKAVLYSDSPTAAYQLGLKQLSWWDRISKRRSVCRLVYQPLVSVVVPVYNVEERWLRRCIDSVRRQIYPHWELCLVDDHSTRAHIRPVLEAYAAADCRIKVRFRDTNGHISVSTNSALDLVSGEYTAFLDHDDELALDALAEMVRLLNRHPDADVVYSDEDKMDVDDFRHSPHFKPQWSPDNLLSHMYTCHLGMYRTSLVREIGGLRTGFEGSQDYDMVLRLTERTRNVYHVGKVLYHWRTLPESTAHSGNSKNYAVIAGEKALQEALVRRGEGAWAETVNCGLYRTHYPLPPLSPRISIILTEYEGGSGLNRCLTAIFQHTVYPDFEIIAVDPGNDPEISSLLTEWKHRSGAAFTVLAADLATGAGNRVNQAAVVAQGELLLLLNGGNANLKSDWLEEMAGYALRPSIGAVGAKVIDTEHNIVHAGIVLGAKDRLYYPYRGWSNGQYGYMGRLYTIANYSAVSAACLMVKKVLFQQVGGFHEMLEMPLAEVDFCLKLKDSGHYHVVVPFVELMFHRERSGTADCGKTSIAMLREYWGNRIDEDPHYNPELIDREQLAQ